MIPELDRPPVSISPAWRIDPDFPERAWPVLDLAIGGQTLHVFALRVDVIPDTGEQVIWREHYDTPSAFEQDLANLHQNADGGFETCSLPGLDGDWCVFAHPAAG